MPAIVLFAALATSFPGSLPEISDAGSRERLHRWAGGMEVAMTVSELISHLKAEPNQLRLVVMSSDAEGNRIGPFREASTAKYLADSTWSGEIQDRENGETDAEWGEVAGVEALVLWPVN